MDVGCRIHIWRSRREARRDEDESRQSANRSWIESRNPLNRRCSGRAAPWSGFNHVYYSQTVDRRRPGQGFSAGMDALRQNGNGSRNHVPPLAASAERTARVAKVVFIVTNGKKSGEGDVDVAGWPTIGSAQCFAMSSVSHHDGGPNRQVVLTCRRVRPSYRMLSPSAPPLNRPRDRRRPSLPPVAGLGHGDKTSIGSGRRSGRVGFLRAFLRAIPTDACSSKCPGRAGPAGTARPKSRSRARDVDVSRSTQEKILVRELDTRISNLRVVVSIPSHIPETWECCRREAVASS